MCMKSIIDLIKGNEDKGERKEGQGEKEEEEEEKKKKKRWKKH